MSSTSIGRGPAAGGNENHDGDPMHKTMGETVSQEAPAGKESMDGAAPDLPPAGTKADPLEPVMAQERRSRTDDPDVGATAEDLDAARGKVPPR